MGEITRTKRRCRPWTTVKPAAPKELPAIGLVPYGRGRRSPHRDRVPSLPDADGAPPILSLARRSTSAQCPSATARTSVPGGRRVVAVPTGVAPAGVALAALVPGRPGLGSEGVHAGVAARRAGLSGEVIEHQVSRSRSAPPSFARDSTKRRRHACSVRLPPPLPNW
jgi:hypothetical protein